MDAETETPLENINPENVSSPPPSKDLELGSFGRIDWSPLSQLTGTIIFF